MTNPYETGEALRQYLDFHYRGHLPDYLPRHRFAENVLGYPKRCADWVVQHATSHGRALDLGCAVGASTFALTTRFREVTGVDFSRRFTETATTLRDHGVFRTPEDTWSLPSDVRKTRARFLQGDACNLPEDLGAFDAALLANLLCRVPDPAACLRGLKKHLKPGAVLVICSPTSWDTAHTPRDKWLDPIEAHLHQLLDPWCHLLETRDMPFVLRIHARRAEHTVAHGSVWRVAGD